MRPIRPTLAAILFLGLLTAASAPLWGCIGSESEPNDRDSDASGPVCSGVVVDGAITKRRDVDWYVFELSAAGTIEIVLDHDNADDFDWFLYPETGTWVESGETSQVPESGSYPGADAGIWFVKVVRYSGIGAYTLELTFPSDPPPPGGGGCASTPRPRKPGGLRTWLTGSGDDACPTLVNGPGLLLMGGGSDVDAAFTQRVAPVIGGGDVVVLRTSGSDGYNDYLFGLMAPDSVETLRVDRRSHADSDFVDWVVRHAEFLWIAGGDQSDYLNQWQGTRLESAIQSVYDRGGVVGGTSAGNAVLSEVIYDPDGILGVYSSEAVTDPCHAYINLSTGFLQIPWMFGVINDTHFEARDRMGRLLSFMARIGEPGLSPTVQPITGIGVDEQASIYIGPSGQGVVDGQGAVYVLREDAATTRLQVECGAPVLYEDVLRYRLTQGDSFDFASGSSSVGPYRIGIDGGSASFYLPSDPYF